MLTGITKLLLEELELRDMPVAVFAQLAALQNISGASKTKLNEYFREAAVMPGHTSERLWALMLEIREYCDSTATPVALTNAEEIKKILDERREAKEVIGELAEQILTEKSE